VNALVQPWSLAPGRGSERLQVKFTMMETIVVSRRMYLRDATVSSVALWLCTYLGAVHIYSQRSELELIMTT